MLPPLFSNSLCVGRPVLVQSVGLTASLVLFNIVFSVPICSRCEELRFLHLGMYVDKVFRSTIDLIFFDRFKQLKLIYFVDYNGSLLE